MRSFSFIVQLRNQVVGGGANLGNLQKAEARVERGINMILEAKQFLYDAKRSTTTRSQSMPRGRGGRKNLPNNLPGRNLQGGGPRGAGYNNLQGGPRGVDYNYKNLQQGGGYNKKLQGDYNFLQDNFLQQVGGDNFNNYGLNLMQQGEDDDADEMIDEDAAMVMVEDEDDDMIDDGMVVDDRRRHVKFKVEDDTNSPPASNMIS